MNNKKATDSSKGSNIEKKAEIKNKGKAVKPTNEQINLAVKKEIKFIKNIPGSGRAVCLNSRIPIPKKPTQIFAKENPSEHKACSNAKLTTEKNINETTFILPTLSKELVKECSPPIDQTRQKELDAITDLTVTARSETYIRLSGNRTSRKDKMSPTEASASKVNLHKSKLAGRKAEFSGKYAAHSGMKLLSSPKKMTLKPFSFDLKVKPPLRRSKTEDIAESSYRRETVTPKITGNSRSRSLKENMHTKQTNRKTLDKTIRKCSPLQEQKLQNIMEDAREKTPPMFPLEYRAHSGLKFLPSPEKTIVKPFSFDATAKRPPRRSRTENLTESSFRHEKVSSQKPLRNNYRSLREKPNLKETNRKTADKSKSNPLAEQKLANIAKAASEEAQVVPKNYAGHSGLTFKLKPPPKTSKRAFDMKPKNPEYKDPKIHDPKPSDEEPSTGNT